MGRGIAVTERHLHPDLAIAQLDRADRYIVRPQVKGATTLDVEAGVMPMAGQDAILDAAAVERKAHMRTAVVDGEDASTVIDDEDWEVIATHDQASLGLQFL